MEDFEFIDALAKRALSDKTATPSENGWNVVQEKIKRKKRRRFFGYILLLVLIGSLGIFSAIHFRGDTTTNVTTKGQHDNNQFSITNKSETTTNKNADSRSNTTTNNNNSNKQSTTTKTTTNQILGNTSVADKQNKNNTSNVQRTNTTSTIGTDRQHLSYINEEEAEAYLLEGKGVKLYDVALITPETLRKERKKQSQTKTDKVYENFDLLVGFNGFMSSNDYQFTGSYVVEVSYTEEKKLKNNYYFTYGGSVQFRNLRFKNDSLSFNRGELSLNLLSSVEKRFGDFGVEAGAYAGYEFYSPNNDRFNDNTSNFFEQKINYGLFSGLHYRRIALIFKYEFSPFINYLGDKKFGAFTIGVKYDF